MFRCILGCCLWRHCIAELSISVRRVPFKTQPARWHNFPCMRKFPNTFKFRCWGPPIAFDAISTASLVILTDKVPLGLLKCWATVLQQIPQMGAVRNKTPLLKPKTTRIADQNLCQILPYVPNCLGGHQSSAHVHASQSSSTLRLDDLILEMVKLNSIVWSQVDL